MKILAIAGSLRKGSYNRQLALAAKEIISDRAEFELLDYSDVPLFNEDIEFPAPASVKWVREQVKAADAIWFFSPEYNHFFSGVLKNLIDWLSRNTEEEKDLLSGKPTAISGASLGMGGTVTAQDHLVTLISFLDMDVMNDPRLTIPRVSKQADENGNLKLTDSAPFLKEQADAFLAFIEKRLK
ncbi:MAG TPA: NADPH-dependent FMN reductase [Oscillospiraceae bacterium]|nr:NADPH-dependent FMN reductase [Oscillospiraceae bacterium]